MSYMRGLSLIFISLLIIVVVGMVYNNFTASGYSNVSPVTSCTGLQCPQYNQNPCTVATNCQIGTPAYLNPTSPFTKLLSGDIIGFFTSFFTISAANTTANQSAAQAPQGNVTFNGGYGASSPVCVGNDGNGNFNVVHYATAYHTSSQVQFQCTGITFPRLNFTAEQPLTFTGLYWNGTITNALNHPQFQLSSWNIVGKNASYPAYVAQCITYGNATDVTSIICSDLTGSLPGYAPLNALNPFANPSLGMFFVFMGGILLMILSLGMGGQIQVVASGFSWVPNGQGTRFAAALGMGLIVWAVLYSEFGNWINNATLGDGLGTFLGFVFAGMFFFGIWDAVVTTSGQSSS